MDLHIELFGGFQVSVQKNPVPDSSWRLRKARNVVKLLSLSSGHRLHREQLLELLWPDLEADAAINNLHKTIYVARRTLEPSPTGGGSFLHFQDDVLEMTSPGELLIDVEAFEKAAASARQSGSAEDYRTCLDLYKGELLPEDRYEEWAIERREALGNLYISLLLDFAQASESSRDFAATIDSLKRVVASDPTHEDAHARLMRLYAATGERHQAIRQFQRLAQSLDRELGVEPDASSVQLYDEIVAGRVAAAEPAQAIVGATRPKAAKRFVGRSTSALVGRDDELERVGTLLDGLRDGRGGCLMLSGAVGVGKSRLAQEIAERASISDAIVLWGGAYEQEQHLPYGPFTEAIEAHLQGYAEIDIRSLVSNLPPEVQRLLPGMGLRLGRSAPTSDNPDMTVLFAGVRTLLERIAQGSPAVLVLDDLHAADQASLELFHYLVRSAEETGTLILVTYRPEEAGSDTPLGGVLAALHRLGLITDLSISPLESAESEVLVGSILGNTPIDNAVYQSIYESAEGNPLYTEEIIRSLAEGDSLEQVDGRWRLTGALSTVPVALSEIIGRRLLNLDDVTQRVLNVAAVIGRESAYPVLRSASELSEEQLLDGLDQALARRVIEETDDGYRFVHPLHKTVLYQGLNRPRRQLLHGKVAEVMEQLYASNLKDHAEPLALHFASSADRVKAVPHLIASGQHASFLYANEQALSYYEQARGFLSSDTELATSGEMVVVLEEMGDLKRRFGDAASSLEFYEDAMKMLEKSGDEDGAFRLRGKAALSAITAEEIGRANELLNTMLDVITEQSADQAVARTYSLLAQLQWHSAKHTEALAAAETAILAAHSSGDDEEQARAYEVMALACHSLGDWQKGIEYDMNRNELGVSGFDVDSTFDAHL